MLVNFAIYGYFAQTEREIISERTKQGLAVARAKGKILGRPKFYLYPSSGKNINLISLLSNIPF